MTPINASHYATINSTAYVATVEVLEMSTPVLTIVDKAADDPVPTNSKTIVNSINLNRLSMEFPIEGAKYIRDNTTDNLDTWQI
jgi:hypothetical protein